MASRGLSAIAELLVSPLVRLEFHNFTLFANVIIHLI